MGLEYSTAGGMTRHTADLKKQRSAQRLLICPSVTSAGTGVDDSFVDGFQAHTKRATPQADPLASAALKYSKRGNHSGPQKFSRSASFIHVSIEPREDERTWRQP